MKESWKWIQETKHIWRIYDDVSKDSQSVIAELVKEDYTNTYVVILYMANVSYKQYFFEISSIQVAQQKAQKWIINKCGKMAFQYNRIRDYIKEM